MKPNRSLLSPLHLCATHSLVGGSRNTHEPAFAGARWNSCQAAAKKFLLPTALSFSTATFIGLLGVSTVQANTLNISIAAQGAAYTNMVRDAKLRGDGGLENWNLGAGSGGTDRFYPNYLADGTTSSGRLNTFVQRFDVSSIPPGSTINSATLTEYFANQTANTRTWTNVHLSRLQPGKDWVETYQPAPGTSGPHYDGSVTWNRQVSYATDPPGVPWASAGATNAADIDLGTTQTFNLVGVDGSATTIVRDITAWVQDWVNTPTNNTGVLWWGGNNATTDRYFYFGVKEDGAGPASDAAAAAPTLVINFQQISITCPPATNVQFFPAPATNRAEFEAQGGTVTELTPGCTNFVVTSSDSESNPGSCCNVITRTYTVSAACDTGQICVQTITVSDDTNAPSITCPTNVTVQCASGVPAAATNSTGFIAQGGTISDNCGGPVTVNSSDAISFSNCVNQFTITRTYTVTDQCNNSTNCDQTITVNDINPPTITCPTNVTVQCASDVPAAATNSAGFIAQGGTISENCGGSVTVNSSDAISFSNCVNQFTITRTYTVTDGCNNSTNCDQTITVNDSTPPVFANCPATTLDLGCSPTNIPTCTNYNVTATDCGTNTLTCAQVDTVTNTVHTRTLTYTATDACGNSNSCQQVITWMVDSTPPVVANCPAPTLVLGCNPTNIPTCTSYNVTATDNSSTGPLQYCWTNFAGGFSSSYGADTDSADNIYIADRGAGAIRKITPGGVVTTLASGFDLVELVVNKVNGRIYFPNLGSSEIKVLLPPSYTTSSNIATGIQAIGLGVDSTTDTVYVGALNDNTIKKITSAGVVTTLAGNGSSGSVNSNLLASSFNAPCGIAVDGSGNLYVADRNNSLIRKIDIAGNAVTTVAGSGDGCGDGTGVAAKLRQPTGITLGPDGNFYIADQDNFTVRKMTPAGVVTTIGGLCFTLGDADGCGSVARFGNLGQVAVDSTGHIYTADRGSSHVSKGTPTPTDGPLLVTCASVETVTNTTHTRTLTYTATDACGNSDSCEQVITWTADSTPPLLANCPAPTLALGCNPNNIPTCTNYTVTATDSSITGVQYCWTNFAGPGGDFGGAYGATVDSDGNVYVSALGSGRLSKVTPAGAATTLGALVGSPVEIVVSTTTTNLYVASLNTGVRKVVPPYGAGDVTTIDSTYVCIGVGVDSASDTVYAGDLTGHTIRIISPSGGGSALAGGGSGFVDNTNLLAARFQNPCGIAVVVSGGNTNLYVADRENNRIRKIDIGNNLVTTLAGGGPACADGTGGAAGFLAPTGVTLGPDGNLYVADQDNFVVRKITLPGGVVTTLGGLCFTAGNADGCGTAARFSNVGQVGVDSAGTLYVADRAPNSRVSKGTPTPTDGPVAVTCTPVDTITNCTHTRTLTYTATDSCGNSANCSQVITWTTDSSPPVITNCPPPTLNLGCNPTNIPACTNYSIGATDDCGPATITCTTGVTVVDGCLRTRTNTFTATDSCGNSSSCSQVVTWTVDTTPPVFTKCPTTRHLVCNPTTIPDCDLSPTNVAATDNCGTPVITCSKVDVVSGDGCLHTRTLTYTATDTCGNSNTCVQQIIWTTDTVPPYFTRFPTNMTLCNPSPIPACNTSSTNIEAEDVCSAPVITCTSVVVTNGCVRTNTLTYRATDACGNFTEGTQVIVWTQDTNPPVFVNCPSGITNAGCNPVLANLPHCVLSVTATDDCSTPVVTCSQTQVTNGCVRTRTVTYTAVDACNNSNTCVQVINWTVDTVLPTFTNCPGNMNLGCNPVSIPDCNPAVGATDGCGPAPVTCGRVDATNGCVRTRTLTYTATDGCGNVRTCTQVITWTEDTASPVFTKCPTNMNLGVNPVSVPGCDTSTNNVMATGCTPVTITCNSSDSVSPDGCVHTRTNIYTARSACTNINTCTQVITWTVQTNIALSINLQDSYCWANFAGPGGAFSGAYGATVDSDGTIYVSALGSGSLSSITPGGVATTLGASVGSPVEIVVSTNTHNLYVASLSTGVKKVVPPYGAGDVTTIDSTYTCIGVGVDSASDTVYAGDLTAHTIRIIPPGGGGGSPLAGGGSGFVDNTNLLAARFQNPCGIAVVVSGGNTNLYVADRENNRIRKIDIGNNLVTTLAGGGPACADGTGAAAGFLAPTGVTLGPDGNLYVADQDNFVVRKITLPGGVVTTLGGRCFVAGNADGCGTAARFSNVGQVGVSSTGTLYVADRAPNSRVSKGTLTADSAVVISWPETCIPFVLEETHSLTPPIIWTATSGAVVVDNDLNTVTVPLSTTNTFYRLRAP